MPTRTNGYQRPLTTMGPMRSRTNLGRVSNTGRSVTLSIDESEGSGYPRPAMIPSASPRDQAVTPKPSGPRGLCGSTIQYGTRASAILGGLTIPSSAASEASPLQRVVRPTVREAPNKTVKMRRPSWPKSLSSPRCTDQGLKLGLARAASLDLPRLGLRDFDEEGRLRMGRTVHHDEPRTPDYGRDSDTRRDEPRFGLGDFAEGAADIGEWRRAR